MKLTNILNPIHLYKKRQWIWPNLTRLTGNSLDRMGIPRTANELRLRRLRNRHRGRRAFVVGNGPSLRIEDLDRLKREISFACNKIFLAFDQTDWRPTYYGAEDILMFQKTDVWATVKSLPSIKLLPTYADEYVRRIPGAIYYQHAYEDRYPAAPPFSTDAHRCVHGGNTVLYIMLQFAYYMGIREVYLLGVDSNYTTPKEVVKNTSGGTFDFYRVADEKNHFHPDYLRPGDCMCDPNVNRHLKSYEAAKQAFEANGCHIYNATRGGKLEAFSRVEFDSLF
jgi:Protein of unknown function DUF115